MNKLVLKSTLIIALCSVNGLFAQWSGSSSNAGTTTATPTNQNNAKSSMMPFGNIKRQYGLSLTLYNVQAGRMNAHVFDEIQKLTGNSYTSSTNNWEIGFVQAFYDKTKSGSYVAMNLGNSTMDLKSTDPTNAITSTSSITDFEIVYGYGFRQVLRPNPAISANDPLPDGYMALQYTISGTYGFIMGDLSDKGSSYSNSITPSAYGLLGLGTSFIYGKHVDVGLTWLIPVKGAAIAITDGDEIVNKSDFGTCINMRVMYLF